jgi:hypothetical protein
MEGKITHSKVENISIKGDFFMINSVQQIGITTAKNLNEKINNLTNTLMNKNLLDKCTPKDKRDISVILNEIKYDLHRIKNLKFMR